MVVDIKDRRLCVNKNAGNGACIDCKKSKAKFPYKRCFPCFKRWKEEQEEKNAVVIKEEGEGTLWKYQDNS